MKLVIDAIEAHRLFDTGNVFDKQDPCVKLTLGTKLLGKTQRSKDSGTEASFAGEIFEGKVKSLEKHTAAGGLELRVDVYNQGLIGGLKAVGHGVVSLLDELPTWAAGDTKRLSVKLLHTDEVLSVYSGVVLLTATLVDSDASAAAAATAAAKEKTEQAGNTGDLGVPAEASAGTDSEAEAATGSAGGSNKEKKAKKDRDEDVRNPALEPFAARKAEAKAAIKLWLEDFESAHGRQANALEKEQVDPLYMAYNAAVSEYKEVHARLGEAPAPAASADADASSVTPSEGTEKSNKSTNSNSKRAKKEKAETDRDKDKDKGVHHLGFLAPFAEEKAAAKAAIKTWLGNFEAEHGRSPKEEEKAGADHLYNAYNEANTAYKAAETRAKAGTLSDTDVPAATAAALRKAEEEAADKAEREEQKKRKLAEEARQREEEEAAAAAAAEQKKQQEEAAAARQREAEEAAATTAAAAAVSIVRLPVFWPAPSPEEEESINASKVAHAALQPYVEQKHAKKSAIKEWIESFKAEHGHAPSAEEKSSADALYIAHNEATEHFKAAEERLRAGTLEKPGEYVEKIMPGPRTPTSITSMAQKPRNHGHIVPGTAPAAVKGGQKFFDETDLETPAAAVAEAKAAAALAGYLGYPRTAPGAVQSQPGQLWVDSPTPNVYVGGANSGQFPGVGVNAMVSPLPLGEDVGLQVGMSESPDSVSKNNQIDTSHPERMGIGMAALDLKMADLRVQKYRQMAVRNQDSYGIAKSNHMGSKRLGSAMLDSPSPRSTAPFQEDSIMIPGQTMPLHYNIRVKDAIPRQKKAVKLEMAKKMQYAHDIAAGKRPQKPDIYKRKSPKRDMDMDNRKAWAHRGVESPSVLREITPSPPRACRGESLVMSPETNVRNDGDGDGAESQYGYGDDSQGQFAPSAPPPSSLCLSPRQLASQYQYKGPPPEPKRDKRRTIYRIKVDRLKVKGLTVDASLDAMEPVLKMRVVKPEVELGTTAVGTRKGHKHDKHEQKKVHRSGKKKHKHHGDDDSGKSDDHDQRSTNSGNEPGEPGSGSESPGFSNSSVFEMTAEELKEQQYEYVEVFSACISQIDVESGATMCVEVLNAGGAAAFVAGKPVPMSHGEFELRHGFALNKRSLCTVPQHVPNPHLNPNTAGGRDGRDGGVLPVGPLGQGAAPAPAHLPDLEVDSEVRFRSYMAEERVVMEGDPPLDDEISVTTGVTAVSVLDEAALHGLRRVQQSMLSFGMGDMGSSSAAAQGGGSVMCIAEQQQSLAGGVSGVSLAGDPKLALYKLLMKNPPREEDCISNSADPSYGIPYSKVHAKKLDISKGGPLSRNIKSYDKPWKETPKQHVRDPPVPSSVGRCILSLKPMARDLVYAPQLSISSQGSSSADGSASVATQSMGYYPPGEPLGGFSYVNINSNTNSQVTFSDGYVPVVGSSLESQSVVVPGTGGALTSVSASAVIISAGIAALPSVAEAEGVEDDNCDEY